MTAMHVIGNVAIRQVVEMRGPGFTPDFLPARLSGVWNVIERLVEVTPGVNTLAAHNVVVARKP